VGEQAEKKYSALSSPTNRGKQASVGSGVARRIYPFLKGGFKGAKPPMAMAMAGWAGRGRIGNGMIGTGTGMGGSCGLCAVQLSKVVLTVITY